jgi:hypothetical protein
MNIVEVGIIQISSVVASHSRGQRIHPDLLALRNNPPEGLKLHEPVTQINDCFFV